MFGAFAGRCLGTLTGHEDEVLDVGFDFTGQYLLSASADGTGRIYNATTHQLINKLQGHDGEVSKVVTVLPSRHGIVQLWLRIISQLISDILLYYIIIIIIISGKHH